MTAKPRQLAALFVFVGFASVSAQQFETAVAAVAAPIRLSPDSRTPLATLEPGTTLKVLSRDGEWCRVSFRDSRFGERIGFVRTDQLTFAVKTPAAATPVSPASPPAAEGSNGPPPVTQPSPPVVPEVPKLAEAKPETKPVSTPARTASLPPPARTPVGSGTSAPAKLKDVKIRGYVTQMTSTTEFQIEDYRITRDEVFSLDFENASPEVQFQLQDIRVGVELQIRGQLNEESGALRAIAIKVDLEQFKSIKQTAIVSSAPEGIVKVDAGWAGQLQADGQTISIAPATQVLFKLTKREKKLVEKQQKEADAATEESEDDFEPLASLDQVTIGMAMTYEGRRDRETGHIVAERVEFSNNDLEDGEAKMWKSLKVSTKAAQGLRPGELKIDRVGKYKLLDDEGVQSYVAAIGTSLIPAYQSTLSDADPRKIPFQFHVVIDDEPNAFATPNGIVVVHTGLIETLNNEAQLAAVLGHEIAHSTQEHSWRRQEFHKKKRLAIGIAGAVASAYGLREIGDIANLVNSAIVNGHSRSTENQADRVGLQYMVAAGYDPREAPNVWKMMAGKTGVRATNFFWSSHENHATRRSYLMNELKNNYRDLNYGRLSTYEEQFGRVKQTIMETKGKKKIRVTS